MFIRVQLPLAALLLGACVTPTAPATAPDSDHLRDSDISVTGPPADAKSATLPVSLEGWRSEHIALPPEFAPTLPSGAEILLFAPGMFDAEADDFWSYAFVMLLDEFNVDAESLAELFEVYFDGLLRAVAEGAGKDVGTDPATVTMTRIGDGHFEASVSLIDAFVTFQTIELRIVIDVEQTENESTRLRVQASPLPVGHELWNTLEFAVNSLEL